MLLVVWEQSHILRLLVGTLPRSRTSFLQLTHLCPLLFDPSTHGLHFLLRKKISLTLWTYSFYPPYITSRYAYSHRCPDSPCGSCYSILWYCGGWKWSQPRSWLCCQVHHLSWCLLFLACLGLVVCPSGSCPMLRGNHGQCHLHPPFHKHLMLPLNLYLQPCSFL